MSKFSFTREGGGGVIKYKFAGYLDEDSVLPPAADAQEIHVDMSEIKNINSMGIQGWVKWHMANVKPGVKLVVLNCPTPVVNQINFVANFLPAGSEVRSFQVPYFCNSCNANKSVTIHNGVEFTQEKGAGKKNLMLAEVKCACGDTMEVEALEATYFRFLTTL